MTPEEAALECAKLLQLMEPHVRTIERINARIGFDASKMTEAEQAESDAAGDAMAPHIQRLSELQAIINASRGGKLAD